ncbi:TonB-dependent receptor plug domain-containing protein [Methylohalobius crimeensis]|uniref:TonB-dependent receptor plug domain-containing protein n=1 Tax=Methylohalobius crimeensis TaxID=244365 RepID=UPI0003B3B9A0|nr:TonB-dependent receptor [Methylohalobius crimeensis]
MQIGKRKWVLAPLAAAIASQGQYALAQYEELPTLTVEGEVMESGTASLQPGTSGTLDASDFLKRVPGGNVNRNGPLTGIAQFRGAYAERVNVLTNGVALRNAGPNAMDSRMSHIPSALMRTVKVYREVTPVSTGLETLGGSVITESRRSRFTDSEQFDLQGFGSAGYMGVSNGHYGAGLLGVANQNYRFHFSGSVERGRDYRFDRTRRVNPSKYSRETYNLGFGLRRAGHEFGFDYDNKYTGFTGTPSLPMDIRFINTDVFRGNYGWDLGGGWKLAFAGFYQDADHKMDNFSLRPAPTDPTRWREMKTDVEAGGYKLALTVPGVGPGSLEVGVDGDVGVHNATVSNPNNAAFFVSAYNDVNRNRYGAYAEWEGAPLDKLLVTAGVRYRFTFMDAGQVDGTPAMMMPAARMLRDRFNASDRRQDQHDVDVALNFRYALQESLDLVLGLARKTNAPTYQQRYTWLPLEATGGLADGRVYIGDVGLDSEKAYEAVAGFDLHLDHLVGDWVHDVYFEPRGFYRYVNDYIQGQAVDDPTVVMAANMILPGASCPNDPTPGDGNAADCVLQWANVDAQFYGTDIQAGFAVGDHFRVDGLMNYTRGIKLSGKDDNLYRIAPLNGRIRGTFSWWDLAFSTELVAALRQDKVAEYNNERQTSDWSVLNLRLQYQPSYQYVAGLKIALGVDNVFDNEHTDHLNGLNRARSVRDLPVGTRVPNPGRNLYATVAYDF